MTDTLLRHWQMLRLVPRAPHKITADALCNGLADHGYLVSKRTVERDLEKLSVAFPLVSDNRSKPYGWQWHRDAPRFDIPAMDMSTALTFHFVNKYLEPLLPGPVRDHLASHIDAAEKLLNAQASHSVPRWSEKVMVIPQGLTLNPPSASDEVTATVYTAVLQDRQLEMRYKPRSHGKQVEKSYTVNPLGLVLRNQLCYLVATAFDYTDILQFAMHRVVAAELLDGKSKRPKGFSLRKYVEEGAFAYPVGDRVTLKAKFDADVAHHLEETPLSDDQRLATLQDGRVRVSASVQDTAQLRWWLLGFGERVEVEGPASLREEMARTARTLAQYYS